MKNRNEQNLWHDAFDLCANSLHWLAGKLDPIWPGGMDYVRINVILFCIVLPIILFGSPITRLRCVRCSTWPS